MASIRKEKNKNGIEYYRVKIRKKNNCIYKSFKCKESAEIYAAWKENLIDTMDAFDVPLKSRIRFCELVDLKCNDPHIGESMRKDIRESYAKLKDLLRLEDRFVEEITYDEWLNAAKELLSIKVYRGAKTKAGERLMSPTTLRRIFSCLSSVFSYSTSFETPFDNHALKVVQTFIKHLIEKEKQIA